MHIAMLSPIAWRTPPRHYGPWERFEYWRLLLWTLVRKPRQLPLAITLTIYGHHFRRICELYILQRKRRHHERNIYPQGY